MLNDLKLIGTLAKDPVLMKMDDGQAMTFITLAVQRERSSEKVDWIDVAVYSKLAEIVCEYKRQGDLILVNGSVRSYKKGDKTEQGIVASTIEFLRNKNDRTNTASKTESTKEPKGESLLDKAKGFFQ